MKYPEAQKVAGAATGAPTAAHLKEDRHYRKRCGFH